MQNYKDCHFVPLSSQGNIYTLTKLRLANGTNKILVASLRREVYCFEYQEDSAGNLFSTTKEVSFTYIPSGAEIISMDAFNKSESSNDFVIGITIIKNSCDSNSLETYLNIYSEWEENVDLNIESISQNCLNIELKFIPYHLTHTYLVNWCSNSYRKEKVFLLSGSDNQIHIYQENQISHTYKEIDCKENFPEFLKPPSIVIWIDIVYYKDYTERLTAIGCECGYVRLCRVCVKTNQIIFNFSTRFDNTISNVRIYAENKQHSAPPLVKELIKNQPEGDVILNLIVTNTLLPAVFFKDVLKYGLKRYGTLPKHESTSVLSCTEVADIDFDGEKEILLGTSDRYVLLYKYNGSSWVLEQAKKFPTPIFGIKYIDITGDGVRELVVLSMKGLHVLQAESMYVQKVLDEKISRILTDKIKIKSF